MPAAPKELSGFSVLCVDDNPDSLTLLSGVLSRHGAKVTTSPSAEMALAFLRERTFDVIISDIAMPGLDGFDLAHALRAMQDGDEHPTPAVALAGQAAQISGKRRFADFQVYLSKPFDRARLIDIVRRLAEADGDTVKAGTLDLYDADKRALAAVTAGADGSTLVNRG